MPRTYRERRGLSGGHDAAPARYRTRVNLLLLEPSEVDADGRCAIDDRRAQHLRRVLGVQVGQTVRAGVLGGGIGPATVLADDGVTIALRVELAAAAPPPWFDVELVLAVPRPKVVTRTIEIAASFAIRRIDLTNAWRVDKSYLGSPRLDPAALALAARLGAEQGATTHVPELAVHDRLMALLDARWPAGDAVPGTRVIAHPAGPPIEAVLVPAGPAASPLVLAIGPEGGWIDRELDTFVARGFRPASLGAPILRVEAAVAAALGQLLLLHRMRQASPSS
jgi:16S rRNA (uracil1498-N3)-methyltransferase